MSLTLVAGTRKYLNLAVLVDLDAHALERAQPGRLDLQRQPDQVRRRAARGPEPRARELRRPPDPVRVRRRAARLAGADAVIAQGIEEGREGTVLETAFEHGRATLVINPEGVLHALSWLRDRPEQG